MLVEDLGLEHGNSVQTPATHDATEEEAPGPLSQGSAQQVQVTGCTMFVPQPRSSGHNVLCERVASKNVESHSTEPCQAEEACQVCKT